MHKMSVLLCQSYVWAKLINRGRAWCSASLKMFFSRFEDTKKTDLYTLWNFRSIVWSAHWRDQGLGGHGRNESQQSSNTKKAYANGSIYRQYFFDTNYFHLLLGLRSFQKSAFLKLTILFCQYFWCQIWDQWHKLSRKKDMGVFSTQFVPLISILATKILAEQNCQL